MRIIICEVVHLQYTWLCIHKKIPIIAPPTHRKYQGYK